MSAEGKSKILDFCPASVGWPEMVVVFARRRRGSFVCFTSRVRKETGRAVQLSKVRKPKV
jgi:hypothetical protein